MSFTDTDVAQTYSGGGTTFAIPYELIDGVSASAQTEVWEEDVAGTISQKTEGSGNDYTIQGTNVVFNSATTGTSTILVIRALSKTQPTDFTASSSIDLLAIERAFDRNVAMNQEVSEKADRAVKTKKVGGTTGLTFPEPDADKMIVWNSAGTDLANSATKPVTGPGSSTDNALARWDGTTGLILQNGVGILDDSGNISGLANITSSGNLVVSGTVTGVSNLTASGTVQGGTVTATGAVNGASASITGTATAGQVDVDNLRLNGNTLSSTDANERQYWY
jgi:hypothetical protein